MRQCGGHCLAEMRRLKMDDEKKEISKRESSSHCRGHLPLLVWVLEKAEKKTQVSGRTSGRTQ